MNVTDLKSDLNNANMFGTDIVFIKIGDAYHPITNVEIERDTISVFPAVDPPANRIVLKF